MKIAKYNLYLSRSRHPQMVEESSCAYDTEYLTSPDEMVDMLNRCFHLSDMTEEHAYMICLNTKLRPIAVFEVSHGRVDCTPISAREVFIRALISGASMIALAHNHPSGDPGPSGLDIVLCEQMVQASELMRVPLVDFLILGDGIFYSFKEHDLIK